MTQIAGALVNEVRFDLVKELKYSAIKSRSQGRVRSRSPSLGYAQTIYPNFLRQPAKIRTDTNLTKSSKPGLRPSYKLLLPKPKTKQARKF